MKDWNKIETDIKTDSDDWERFQFTVEQSSHSYVNLFVEKGRKYNIPKPLSKIIAYVSLLTPIPIMVAIYSQLTWDKSNDTSTI